MSRGHGLPVNCMFREWHANAAQYFKCLAHTHPAIREDNTRTHPCAQTRPQANILFLDVCTVEWRFVANAQTCAHTNAPLSLSVVMCVKIRQDVRPPIRCIFLFFPNTFVWQLATLQVVRSLGNVQTNKKDRPLQPVKILTATVVAKPSDWACRVT